MFCALNRLSYICNKRKSPVNIFTNLGILGIFAEINLGIFGKRVKTASKFGDSRHFQGNKFGDSRQMH